MTVLILILVGGALAAQQPPAAAPTTTPTATGPSKTMFMSFRQAMSETEEGKRELAKIQNYVAEQNRERETRTQELQNRQQQYQEQERALNPQTAAEMQRELARLDYELKRFVENIEWEIRALQRGLYSTLGPRIQGIVEEEVQAKGYSAILYLDVLLPEGSILPIGHVNPAYVVTQDIISRYNVKCPVAAAAASPQQ